MQRLRWHGVARKHRNEIAAVFHNAFDWQRGVEKRGGVWGSGQAEAFDSHFFAEAACDPLGSLAAQTLSHRP